MRSKDKMTYRRLFIGYPISDTVGNDLISHVVNEINDVTHKIRWTIPGNFHITAKFIGDMDENLIPQLITIVEEVASKASSFEVNINKIAAFPKPSSTFLAASVNPHQQLSEINKELEKKLTTIGIKGEKCSYQPHITLGQSLRLGSCREVPIYLRLKLSTLIIYESILKKDGSRYFSLYSCSLA